MTRQHRNDSLVALVLLTVTFFVPQHARANPPDWLLALQRVTLPEYPPETDAAVLLEEARTVVDDKGEVRSYFRVAFKILSPSGAHLARVSVPFDSETEVSGLQAWNLKSGGIVHDVTSKEAVVTQFSDFALFQDTKTMVLVIPQVDTGSVIGYEYEQHDRPSVLQASWYFQQLHPVLKSRFVLELPAGWEYRYHIANHADMRPQEAGKNRWIWEMENLDALPDEEGMPPVSQVSPRLSVAYLSAQKPARARSFDSWNELAAWISELMTPRAATSGPIAEQARQLGSPRAAAEFVQKQIRYVAVEIGIGGYQPHFADETFRNKYGDCKDKVNLLRSLLQPLGIPVYPVMIHAGGHGLSPEFPSPLYFNHVIAALPLAEDQIGVTATIQHPKLGRLMLFDPTDSLTAFGQIPVMLQGSKGLLVDGPNGYVIDVPVAPPAINRTMRNGKFELLPNGGIKGDYTEYYFGAEVARERQALLDVGHEQWLKVADRFLATWLPGVGTMKYSVGNLTASEPLTETYQFQAPFFAQQLGDLLLFRPCVLGAKALALTPQTDRKLPFQFHYLRLLSDGFEITLPAGYALEKLPEPVERDDPFAHYRRQIVQEGNILKFSRTLELKQLLIAPESVAALRQFFQFVDHDERNLVILKRTSEASVK